MEGRTQSIKVWCPPPSSWFKLNFDAALFANLDETGMRVIEMKKGEVMAFISARGPSVVDSEEVEIMACRKALEFAVDVGFTELSIGSHSTQYTMLASRTWMVHGWLC